MYAKTNLKFTQRLSLSTCYLKDSKFKIKSKMEIKSTKIV